MEGITVDCCPNPIPATLTAKFENDGASFEISYDEGIDTWKGTGALNCGDEFEVTINCGPDNLWDITVFNVTQGEGFEDFGTENEDFSVTCDPFGFSFDFDVGGGCQPTDTVTIST